MNVAARQAPLFGLETPHPLQPTQNYFQLIGWAFLGEIEKLPEDVEPQVGNPGAGFSVANDTEVVPPLQRGSRTAEQHSVRVVVGTQIFLPVERIERDDVA